MIDLVPLAAGGGPAADFASFPKAIALASVGWAAIAAGGVSSALRSPSSTTRSVIQHAAAGTVFVGLVIDVLDELLKSKGAVVVFSALGLLLGLGVMLGIRAATERSSDASTLGAVIVVDLIVDGGLIGLSASLDSPTALLLAIAFAPEVSFLGITVSGSTATAAAAGARSS